MDADRARLTLEVSIAKVERGDEDDAYLRSAVSAAIVLLGGEAVVDDDEDRELLVDAVEATSDAWDGTGLRAGW